MKKVILSLLIVLCFPLNVLAEEDKLIHTLVSGIDTFTIDNYSNFTDNMTVEGMVLESKKHLRENLENYRDKDIMYRGFHTLTDKYGEEKDVFTYVMFISKDDIKKINEDNWNPPLEDFVDFSKGFYLHPVFKNTKFYSKQKTDEKLPGFDGVINGTYVNNGTMGIDPSKKLQSPGADVQGIDTVWGPLNPEGKKMLNENLYEEEIDGNIIQYSVYDENIFIVSITFEEEKTNFNPEDDDIISLIKKYTYNDIYLVEDISDGIFSVYRYKSDELNKEFDVEFVTDDGETLIGIAMNEKI